MKNLLKERQRIFYAFTIFNLLVPLVNILFAYSIKLIIDSGITQNYGSLLYSLIGSVGIVLTYAALNYVSLRLRNSLCARIIAEYTDQVFNAILRKKYRDFSTENSAKFIAILTESIKKIEKDYLIQFFKISRNLSLMTFSLLAMFIGNWLLASFIMLATILPVLISKKIGTNSASLQKELLISQQNYLSKVKDILLGFLVIKSFQVTNAVTSDFIEQREKLSRAQWRSEKFTVLARVLSELSGMLVFLVAFGAGMFLVFYGQTTIGSVTAIVQLVNFVVMPLNDLGTGIHKFREEKATVGAVEEIICKEAGSCVAKKEFEDPTFSSITFADITFSYPNSEEKVISNLSLTITKGEKIAIVGMSGSGKTTLLNLLLRFYDPDCGQILIDNKDLAQLCEQSIYNLMAVVQQSIYIFDDTLRANITLNQEFSEAELLQAINLSGLSEFVLESEDGLSIRCGENGANLSGGQKQRLCIARALIRKTPILLLDEATSSIDNQVSTEIENSLLDLDHLTVLNVTHKYNERILKKFDRIIFMKNGEIVEEGSFYDLYAKKSEFYSLFRLSQ